MAKTAVGSMSEWSGVLKDFFRQIHDGSHTLEQIIAFNNHQNPFDAGATNNYSELLKEWGLFYRDAFGLEVNFDVRIPPKRKGFDRLIVVAEGMTSQRFYDKCAELFPSWKWTNENMDKIVKSVRTAENGAYAIWVRNRVEADEELKNVSANDAKTRNINGITLEERLIFELKFFRETGKHLDVKNVTLCTGSRDDDGDVPCVSCRDDKMRVHRYDSDYASDILRLREAVS